MKNILVLSILFLTVLAVNSQTIHTKTYCNTNDHPIIFLHGGTGHNSVGFEATTAQKLSENGFYVIVYDRGGEGRKATLIGYSRGGIVATLFEENYPNKIEYIVLVGAPVSMQKIFKTILSTLQEIYLTKNFSVNFRYINILENMDKSSIEYSSYCFGHAMQNGFYSLSKPKNETLIIYSKFKMDTLLTKYSSQMICEASEGFWKIEKQTTIDLTSNLKIAISIIVLAMCLLPTRTI